jgi:hypothetical protein
MVESSIFARICAMIRLFLDLAPRSPTKYFRTEKVLSFSVSEVGRETTKESPRTRQRDDVVMTFQKRGGSKSIASRKHSSRIGVASRSAHWHLHSAFFS